jgi:hypothetical protein
VPFHSASARFQTQMWRLRVADQTRTARADSEFVDGSDRRFTESRIICKPEVVVRGEVDKASHPAVAPYHRNFWGLGLFISERCRSSEPARRAFNCSAKRSRIIYVYR